MKLPKRTILCILLIGLSIVLSLISLLVLPETIQTGISIQNGVKILHYGPKKEINLHLILGTIVGSVIWDLVAKANQKRIEREPQLKSYRLHGALISFLGFFYVAVMALSGLVLLIINL